METSKEYKTGFIEQCLSAGINKQDTEELFKMATYAEAFDNEDFKQGFLDQTVPMNVDKMPMIAKADLVRKAAFKEYGTH